MNSTRVEPWGKRPWDREDHETYHAHRNKKKKKKRFRLSLAMFKRRYIFTDNVHPRKGILSFFLGVIAAVALLVCVKAAFDAQGSISIKYGVGALLALVYSIAGFVLGIMAMKQKKIFRIFPGLGIALNTVNIVTIIALTIVGAVIFS